MRPSWERLGLAILAFLLSVNAAVGQEAPPKITWANPGRKSIELVFESPNHLVLLPVRVNRSEPLWFVLDSGSAYCFIDPGRAQALGLAFEKEEVQASGAGSGSVSVKVIKGAVDFGFQGLTVSVAPAGAMDLASLEPVIGHHIDGILGYDIFQELIVSVDYHAHRIKFSDPEAFHPAPGTQILPLAFRDRVPLVQGRVAIPGQAPEDAKFLVDSGSGDAVDHPLIKKSSGKLLNTITGVGIGKELSGVEGRIDSLQLGSFALRGAVSACCGGSEISSRLIGGQALSRFTVTFDYPHQKLGLKPNASYRHPFSADQSGIELRLDPATKNLVVHGVIESSPATEAGIQPGDVIVAVDAVPSTQLGLDKVKEMFEAESGTHDLTIQRGGKQLTISLRLRHLL
jgi:hypothetical protein